MLAVFVLVRRMKLRFHLLTFTVVAACLVVYSVCRAAEHYIDRELDDAACAHAILYKAPVGNLANNL
jgi:hypothetical protein